MQLLYEVDAVLRAAEFRTLRSPTEDDTLVFEDNSILGFAAVHAGVEDLIAGWKDQQDAFLRRYAAAFRRDPSKAWNIYSVYLTAAPVGESEWEMLGIEADVSATRKIVRGGIITSADVRTALAPVLPLVAGRDTKGGGIDALFAERLKPDEAALFTLVRDRTADERRVVSWLTGSAS